VKAELNESMERHGKPFAGIGPAPERFQQMWERRVLAVQMSPAPWMQQAAENVSLGLVA
jgi:hypothetical protein